MKQDKILVHVIMTGGTIDSRWNRKLDAIELNKESAIPIYFGDYKLLDDVIFSQVCMKDSRDLSDKDRKKLLEIDTLRLRSGQACQDFVELRFINPMRTG